MNCYFCGLNLIPCAHNDTRLHCPDTKCSGYGAYLTDTNMTLPPTTKTPLTDAEEWLVIHLGKCEKVVSAKIARQLELKNQELEAEIERLKKDNHAHCTALMTTAMWEGLEEERDALKLAGDELAKRNEITNSAWVNELGCYPLPYGSKRHIRDYLQANEKALANWQSLTTTKKENEG